MSTAYLASSSSSLPRWPSYLPLPSPHSTSPGRFHTHAVANTPSFLLLTTVVPSCLIHKLGAFPTLAATVNSYTLLLPSHPPVIPLYSWKLTSENSSSPHLALVRAPRCESDRIPEPPRRVDCSTVSAWSSGGSRGRSSKLPLEGPESQETHVCGTTAEVLGDGHYTSCPSPSLSVSLSISLSVSLSVSLSPSLSVSLSVSLLHDILILLLTWSLQSSKGTSGHIPHVRDHSSISGSSTVTTTAALRWVVHLI